MMIQEILVLVTFLIAVGFLLKKFLGETKLISKNYYLRKASIIKPY